MVKLLSILFTLSAITPIFASVFWDLETRDIAESHLFGRELSDAESAIYARDVQGLFSRQHDSEYVDVARRQPISKKLRESNERAAKVFKGIGHALGIRELNEGGDAL